MEFRSFTTGVSACNCVHIYICVCIYMCVCSCVYRWLHSLQSSWHLMSKAHVRSSWSKRMHTRPHAHTSAHTPLDAWRGLRKTTSGLPGLYQSPLSTHPPHSPPDKGQEQKHQSMHSAGGKHTLQQLQTQIARTSNIRELRNSVIILTHSARKAARECDTNS